MVQRINLKDYPRHFQQATANLSNKFYDEAEKSFQKCIQLNPSSYSSYLNLAYIAHIKQNYPQAIRICDLAITMKPYCSEAYYNRCLSLISASKNGFDEANMDILAGLSCLYLQNFKISGSIESLKSSVQYSQNNIQALRLLVILTEGSQRICYKKQLQKYQDCYRVEGEVSIEKTYASAEPSLFRLKGRSETLNKRELKKKIKQYLWLLQNNIRLKQNSSNCTAIPKKPELKLISNEFQVKIEGACFDQTSQFDNNSCTFEKIQIRQSVNEGALRQKSFNFLNIPMNQSLRYSTTQSSMNKSFLSPTKTLSICDSSFSSSRFCHNGCSKCKKQNGIYPLIPQDRIKMQIKTLQIFRNQNLFQPKPYLIIYDGENEHVTSVDHEGGYFPKWSQMFYLHKNTNCPYRIQLWHKNYKQKQDFLIGTTQFQSKQGRIKVYFVRRYGGVKKTGYVFLQLNQ